jgi:hypothetical protein
LAVFLSLFLDMGFLIGSWMLRGRWAGPQIWSTRTTDRPLWGFVLIYLLTSLREVVGDLAGAHRNLLFDVVSVAVYLSTLIYLVVIFPVFEVRERGFVHHGRFISWLNIQKYEWESTGGPQDLVFLSLRPPRRAALRLHVRRLFAFLPSPRIRVPADKQDELEAIMKRHLSEWPEP